MKDKELLTDQEKVVIRSLESAWNRFVELRELHSDDQAEFRSGIHKCQNIIMSRPVMREAN